MSGLIPQPFIDDLLQRTDLVELIDSYVPLKKRGTSHLACCPFHNEKTPSFNVIGKKQFYHCFGCGASGNAISFIMNYLNQGFVDAVETLAGRLGLTVPKDQQTTAKINQSQNLYQLLAKVNLFYQKTLKNQGKIAIKYLQQRGLNGETARRYQLGYSPNQWHTLEKIFKNQQRELITTGMLIKTDEGKIYDRYRHRIMFPIHDRHGRIIGFGGRTIDPAQKPKYLNSPETVLFQKNRELYGLHQVIRHQKDIDAIIIVEGYMDVIVLAQYGITNAVATLGTATSSYHIQLLSKYTRRLIFCFDGDNAGKQAAWRALENSLPYLNQGIDASFVFLPQEHDPDSLVRQEGNHAFLKRIHNGIPLHQFFFTTLSMGIDLHQPAGKTQLINMARPYLAKMNEGSYKQLLIDDLARKTHIDHHRLTQLLSDKENIKPQEPRAIISRTPIRVAVALLLQNPEIYSSCIEHINPNLLVGDDQLILKKLLLYLSETPQSNTATLIELWRDSPLFESINKLAAWDHQVPEAEQIREFIDIVLFLQKQNKENKIHQLIEKSRQEGLTDEERILLQDMLRKRHQTSIDEK